MPDKVWIVTAGCYSDYHIVAVFDNKEQADALVAHIGHSSDDTVEEWTLNDPKYCGPLDWWYVHMELDGDRARAEGSTGPGDSKDTYHSREAIWGYCRAKDEQHAIKIMNERRAQLLAESASAPS